MDGPKLRIGLALGSGVARGWAHLGVLNALAALGIVPDVVAGTSIGALVGGAWVAGKQAELTDWAHAQGNRMWRHLDFRLSGGGLIGGQRFADSMGEAFGGVTIESLDRPFAAVATDLATGHEVWLREGSLIDAIRASYAMPGIFTPVERDGRLLVDGALVNPVPVSVCRALGAHLVIAVNLNADVFGKSSVQGGETEARQTILEPGSGIRPQAVLMRQLFTGSRRSPSMFAVMAGALNIMQDRLSRSRLAGDPADVLIAPRLGHVGILDFHRTDEIIAEGERAFAEARTQLEDALSVMTFGRREAGLLNWS